MDRLNPTERNMPTGPTRRRRHDRPSDGPARRRRGAAGIALAIALGGGAMLGACTDDDEGATPPTTTIDPTSSTFDMSGTTIAPETGDIAVPDFPGTFPVAVPDLGFGVAVPEGWQATLLTDEAIARLEGATLAQPSFLESARALAESGAVFYGAGIDGLGRVAELKITVADGEDITTATLKERAEATIRDRALPNATVAEGDGRVRIDYRSDATTADGIAVSAFGSELLVADGDRLWSFIVTSEDQDTQDAVLTIVDATVTFD